MRGDGEECPSTLYDDRIAGTELSDHILARGGEDRVDDEVSGGGGRNTIAGGRGDDLRGGHSGERISDRAGGGRDEISGGEDNDEIDVAAGDYVVGRGRSNNDKISSDPGDSLVGCEVFAEIPDRL